jgi:hypothetical protein
MRRLALCSLLSFAYFVCAQQQQPAPQQPLGDIYESGSGAETPAQAVQKLYNLAAEITADPSSGYDAQSGHWPEEDAAWQQWDNSTGNSKPKLAACAAHLGAAIDTAERSYRIKISQQDNSAAQADAQKLLGTARSDFAQCKLADALDGSNGTPGGGSNPPIQGGVGTGPNDTPGTPSGGGPGTPSTTGTPPAQPTGEPETPSSGETPETPPPTQLFGATPQPCNEQEPADDPAAEPQLRYGLGFESGFKACAVSQITLQNVAVAALAVRYKSIALLLSIAAAPQVIDGVLHPPGTSDNTNPYLKGVDEGGRLCTWLLKVSPALIRRCPAAAAPAATSATCSASTLAADLNAATAAVAGQGTRRLDCFQCTMAWLKGESYTPAANQAATNVKDIESQFAQDYGKLVPQGPPLPCWRQAAQEKGIPGSMSPVGIDNEMKNAGSGAKGVIILLQNVNDAIGHVVGVETMGSGKNEHVIYWDAQSGETAKDLVQNAQWIRFYRIQ